MARQDRTLQAKKAGNQQAFLAAYAACGIVSKAARDAKVLRKSVYEWLDSDESFAAEMKAAQQEANEALETEARRRAVDGWDEPVFYEGVEAGTKRKYSDTLLIFIMKGAMPDKYKDRTDITSGGETVKAFLSVHESAV